MSEIVTEAPGRLSEILSELGVSDGDLLLVHSDIRGLIRSRISAEQVGEILLEALGPSGTLVLPTFTFTWARGDGFDHQKSPSEMGRLTEWARTDPRFVRTQHPLYSFAVHGPLAGEFTAYDQPSAYGHGSGFQIVHERGGKILVIGLPWQRSMTYVHYVEEMRGVSYRYFKRFPGDYVDDAGVRSHRDYFMLVRDLKARVETFVDEAEAHCLRAGISQEVHDLRTNFSIVGAADLYDELSEQLERDPSFLHRIGDEEEN